MNGEIEAFAEEVKACPADITYYALTYLLAANHPCVPAMRYIPMPGKLKEFVEL